MKITPEHINHLRSAITAIPHPTMKEYAAAGLSAKRYRWDCLYRAGLSGWICSNIYPYANDEHLDTALRHILQA